MYKSSDPLDPVVCGCEIDCDGCSGCTSTLRYLWYFVVIFVVLQGVRLSAIPTVVRELVSRFLVGICDACKDMCVTFLHRGTNIIPVIFSFIIM